MKAQNIKAIFIGIIGLIMMSSQAMATDEAFTASIKILSSLTVTETSALSFPDTVASGATQDITVDPTDAGAATFDISGQASAAITASIVEASLDMTVGATTITVDTFTLGGSLAADGSASIGAGGALTGTAVGATAHVPANPDAGDYSGTLTYRVVYN